MEIGELIEVIEVVPADFPEEAPIETNPLEEGEKVEVEEEVPA